MASTLDVGKELKELKGRYTETIENKESEQAAEELRTLQAGLYALILAIEGCKTQERVEQTHEAIVLFNTISSDLITMEKQPYINI